ncbi:MULTISPECIES: prealbumin-like fold domain-containing protein [unclassified Enterococcus]|uniref:prealbumin-like fold domain-containing protein n=1 Tax=unclassified Enterococcus TaxID=2608891 RepID=UPI000A33ED49|nr:MULTISPECIES: prealbumin-like fold domain-containing protein [unclassified Enterococcus]OTO67780.1 hypothetical protein A5865_003459 [Enterococcus sp. 12E11_DIV0728]OUZ15718.1 hypothetical protein A5868_000629 [Enterococcus sp. 12F9_DIV0723]
MRKPIQYKRMVPLLLPVVVIIGVFFFYYHGKALKASAPDSLVSVTVDKKAVPNDSLTTEEEEVELALKAKETALLELPYDDTVSVVPLDEEGQEVAYPQIDSSDFKKDKALKFFDDRLKAEQSSEDEKTKEEEANEIMKETEERLPYYQVHKPESKGSFYFELEKDQVQRVRIKRLTKKEKTVNIQLLKDTTKKQGIVVFKATENLEAVNPIPEIPIEPEQAAEEKTEEEETPPANEETPSEAPLVEQAAPEKKGINPQGISVTDPFKVTVTLGKTTGVDVDDKPGSPNGPGYDKSVDDDIVRTFDQVSYRVTAGISNMDSKYSGARVRLDMELPDAWRKDSSGQVRQTAEFVNGTLADTGGGSKKSIRSSWATMTNSATGQAFFTETIETFGGINGDQVKPKFTLTIESATLSAGGTETINQVIDGSVVSDLNDKVYISAKPLVDVKLVWNSTKRSSFEKVSGTTDKPYNLVSSIASYVQLKPLPGREDVTSIKGATYPVGGIKYSIDQKIKFTNSSTGNSKFLNVGTDTDPVQVIAYDGFSGLTLPNRKFTNEYNSYSSSYVPISMQGMNAPIGYTKKTYPPNQPYSNFIGVYDTGDPVVKNNSANKSIDIDNDDYVPISVGKNKWFFSGNQMPSNAEPFSVVAMQLAFPYEYLENIPGTSTKLDYILSVSEISYEGNNQEINSTVTIPWDRHWPGSIVSYASLLNAQYKPLSSASPLNTWSSYGDGATTKGNKLIGSFTSSFTDIEAKIAVLYGRWNANSFKYDNSVSTAISGNENMKNMKRFYGVGPKIPNISLRSKNSIESAYTWYPSVSAAEAAGEIVAVKITGEPTASDGYAGLKFWAPLRAVGKVGAVDSSGNKNIAITNSFTFKDDSETLSKYAPLSGSIDYKGTEYKDDGTIKDTHSPSNLWGDTLYIAPMTIRPTITTNKKTYAPDETVKWTVDGKVESGSENNHKVQFEVKIPKETQYTPGTAKDHKGNPLPNPIIVENSDSYTLKWVLDYMAVGSTYNPKVVFDTSIVSSKLNFDNNVAALKGEVISEVYLEEDSSIKDTSIEKLRTSTNDFTVTNSGVIVVDKVVDKPYIESGNKIDPAKPSIAHPTDFTYTIAFKNHSSSVMERVRILDVLPYNLDDRGTKFKGDYSVVQVKQSPKGVEGVIYYTENDAYYPGFNPNLVSLSGSGWKKLGTDMSVLKKAKSIMAVYDALAPGEDMSIYLTLRPSGQQAGDQYVNTTSLNSHLNELVQGVPSTVRVYGRDLSGVAWYDDNLDGVMNTKTAGGDEDKAKDIPVKLYRTSLEVPSYKKELVKESLTGEEFVTAAGESKVKTGSDGTYKFENLPEGDYIAEFVIGEKVVQREVRVTKKLQGTDPAKNSKADQDTYKTPDYTQPVIADIAAENAADAKHHVPHVNLGLIRPSTIRLFKFETGTATDGDGDGELSEAEKATGKPLKGAEFEVYEGDASSPFATETTDEFGYLNFLKLFPGEHTLIETKAPAGFELLKDPIKVTITEGNQTIKVFQDDNPATELPFTGGKGPLFALLLAASGAMVLGFGYMLWYYRMPKKKGGR